MPALSNSKQQLLAHKAQCLRMESIRATTEAGSGHPTSCASAAEIMSVLFFSVLRFDPRRPGSLDNDAFVLSKGHAAPILYAAWAEAGAIDIQELTNLRNIDSDLEGHPTPRLPFVDVATGSLGQGLSAAVGMALGARLDSSDRRIYVLLGDGESAEGSVWEAAHIASHYGLQNLCATIDINRLGQSEPTMHQHDIDSFRRRWEAFGWNAIPVDGHDVEELSKAYARAADTSDRPTIVLARTIKGKGIPEAENEPGHHGKALSKEDAVKLTSGMNGDGSFPSWQPNLPPSRPGGQKPTSRGNGAAMPYHTGSKPEATRKAFGAALAAIGEANPSIVVLDGDVKNSTYTENFEKVAAERFFQMYIAEQNMVGAAMGLAAAGKIPFAATFACFLTRAYDFLRMAAISGSNIKLVGTHAGISIGEDGPSQMGLEDLAMTCAQPNFTVLYPSDAVSAWRATELAAAHAGPVYVRTSRPSTPVIYGADDRFEIGRAKVVRRSDSDRAVIVAAGVTLFEALNAHDELAGRGIKTCVVDLFSVQPMDAATLLDCARSCHGRVVTVEDHYAHGGFGDAVASVLADQDMNVRKLAVREIPRSGESKELLERYGISAKMIVKAVEELCNAQNGGSL